VSERYPDFLESYPEVLKILSQKVLIINPDCGHPAECDNGHIKDPPALVGKAIFVGRSSEKNSPQVDTHSLPKVTPHGCPQKIPTRPEKPPFPQDLWL
jgi:hypothetical protein